VIRALISVVVIAVSVWVLEGARSGVQISAFDAGGTPVVRYAMADADGPAVVIAHGFAGSQQMMQGYALPLARAGYRVYAFDFLGHGRHGVPMSGDVSSVDGTTRLLVQQTQAVMDLVDAGGQPLALLGHSMATDILVRAAQGRNDVGPMVLISAFSREIDAVFPERLLLVSGAWEAGAALDAVRLVAPDANEGETVQFGDVQRRMVAAPFSEHVSVLQSRVARSETVAWLDAAFGRVSDVRILPTGWAILGLLIGLVVLFPVLARRLRNVVVTQETLSWRQVAVGVGVPAVLAPVVAVPLDPGFLPVLVADYLGVHLAIYGAVQLGLLWYWGALRGRMQWGAFALLLAWCVLFGVALDRYAANFWPTSERLWIIALLLPGGLLFMVADAMVTDGARYARRFAVRAGFFASLGGAVALDFEGLFFLLLIAPVLVLFFAIFGPMGRHVGLRAGPLAPGLALGVVLGWALGVSFPLFQA
jgi:pimeloyl-ACP methyl ester carboxylesterase